MNSGFLSACEMCDSDRPRGSKVPRHAEVIDVEALSEEDPSESVDEAEAPPEEDELCRPFDVDDESSAPLRHSQLSAEELAAFARDGFIIVRGVIPPAECTRLLWERVTPALIEAGVDVFDRASWADSSGAAVKAPDGSDHPIPLTCADARWPALFEAPAVRAILDQLHGGPSSWSWAYGAADGLGWCRAPRPRPHPGSAAYPRAARTAKPPSARARRIHVRFPVAEAPAWTPPEEGWHIDGDRPALDTRASVVVLPRVESAV